MCIDKVIPLLKIKKVTIRINVLDNGIIIRINNLGNAIKRKTGCGFEIHKTRQDMLKQIGIEISLFHRLFH